MTAAVPLIAEALNLAITNYWLDMLSLHRVNRDANWGPKAVIYEERYTADIEALAVALHARLQEQGALG